jgi:putative component of membrane protein insertase Oxa1/YidC/SpoIIIJ protein YidD
MTAPALLAPAACRLIELYQRHISPRKGFRCAYGVRTGRASCSKFGKRAIARTGLLAGVALLRRRFRRCHFASRQLDYEPRDARSGRESGSRTCAPSTSASTCTGDQTADCISWGAIKLAGDACCAACNYL